MARPYRRAVTGVASAVLALGASAGVALASNAHSSRAAHRGRWQHGSQQVISSGTSTPIKHLVVIFGENVSFDHYFGTYPKAANPAGEPAFHAAPGTPSVNGLTPALLNNNPNLSNPQRLDRSQALTCDQNHGYTAEQLAFDGGKMDQFVQHTGGQKTVAQCTGQASGTNPNYAVMDYYDGNTVTGLWNYAQHFALSDNSYGTNFGPSTPGALNVTAGNTFGVICGPSFAAFNAPACSGTPGSSASPGTPAATGLGTDYSDADPYYDVCSRTEDGQSAANTIAMSGQNIGDLLDRAGITWGWFQGGFASPGYVSGRPSTDNLGQVCTGTHNNIGGNTVNDYIPHHEPFQYYASTANPQHLPPTSVAMIGRQDQANHQYDIRDFWSAADNGNLPAVSYLKAPAYQDGHAGYSDPLDEQRFITRTINRLEQLPSWKSTAVVLNWDDSDGWYDHQMGPLLSQSQTSLDALTGTGLCGSNPSMVPTTNLGAPEQGRCGVGPRIPMLVISPLAKHNYVDHTFTTQSSVIRFIEDNWLGGARIGNGSADATSGSLNNMFDFRQHANRRLFLNPSTGQPEPPGRSRRTHRTRGTRGTR